MYKGTTAQCVNVCGALSAGQRDVGVFSVASSVSVGVSLSVSLCAPDSVYVPRAVWGDIIKHASFFQIRTCFMLASWLVCFMLACLTCLLLRGSCLHPPRCVSKGPVVVRLAEWHFNVNVNVKLRTASRRVKFVSKQLENVKRVTYWCIVNEMGLSASKRAKRGELLRIWLVSPARTRPGTA